MNSPLCMFGDIWMSWFFWHQDIKVTHFQFSVMSFIFMQYAFCNSFRHGLISLQTYITLRNTVLKTVSFNGDQTTELPLSHFNTLLSDSVLPGPLDKQFCLVTDKVSECWCFIKTRRVAQLIIDPPLISFTLCPPPSIKKNLKKNMSHVTPNT